MTHRVEGIAPIPPDKVKHVKAVSETVAKKEEIVFIYTAVCPYVRPAGLYDASKFTDPATRYQRKQTMEEQHHSSLLTELARAVKGEKPLQPGLLFQIENAHGTGSIAEVTPTGLYWKTGPLAGEPVAENLISKTWRRV